MRPFPLTVLLSFIGLFIFIYVVRKLEEHKAKRRRVETFGTSPGTMTQLSTSHVPTSEDFHFYNNVHPKIVRREIANMTEEDPGELRPWIFPWYGRGVTLIAQ
jgi:hypothetical protein